MKGMEKFFKEFSSTMNNLGTAIEEEFQDLKASAQKSFYGTSITSTNGDVVITGEIKSLTVNGKEIDLTEKK